MAQNRRRAVRPAKMERMRCLPQAKSRGWVRRWLESFVVDLV
ncbi:MAG: hypothetical protein ACT4PT_04035 [Methanobacteriota archaeon]